MTPDPINEREFELINIIGKQLGSNQRDLSNHLQLSLGQTNMLIRRLVAKGYIRIMQLNQRKAQYLLTPKGLAEKMRKSVKYTINTINSITLIREKLKELLTPVYQRGERVFIIVGKSDLAVLIDLVFKDMGARDVELQYTDGLPPSPGKGVVLICREGIDMASVNGHGIHVLHELAKDVQIVNGKMLA